MGGLEGPIIIIATKSVISVTEAEVGAILDVYLESEQLESSSRAAPPAGQRNAELAPPGFQTLQTFHHFTLTRFQRRRSPFLSRQRHRGSREAPQRPAWTQEELSALKQELFVPASAVTGAETLVFLSDGEERNSDIHSALRRRRDRVGLGLA